MHPKNLIPASKKSLRLAAAICLLAAAAPAQTTYTWTNLAGGNASGSWAAAVNWQGGVVAGGTDNTADFSTLALAADSTVTLDGARTIGNLIFGDAATTPTNNWILATGTGGPLTLAVSAGQPVITATSGSNTISAVLVNTALPGGITKNGNGLVRLGAANLLTNVINNINAGVLQVGNNTALGLVTSGVVGTNNVAAGATLAVAVGAQPANQRVFIAGAGAGGTNGAFRADAGSGNQQNTRWSYALNSIANPAIVLTGDATIRVDGTGYGSQAGFLVGAITNNTSSLAYTLTKTGSGELRIDPPMPIAVANIHVMEGVFGVNGNGGNPIGGTTTVTVDPGSVLAGRRNHALNSAGVVLTLNGTLDLNYNPGAVANNSANAFSDLVGVLLGNGLITNSYSLAPQLLYVTSGTSNSIFGGTIATGTNGPVSLRKEGQGSTMWLTGSCAFNGTNIVAGGIQYIDGAWNPTNGGFVVGPQSGATNATLAGNGSTVSPITLAGGGFVSAGDPTLGGGTLTVSNIAGAGGVIVSNANLNVTAAIGSPGGYVGSLYLTNGTLTLPLISTGPSAFASTLTVDGAVTIAYTSANPTVGQFPLIAYTSLGGLAGGGTNGITLIPPAGTTAYLSNNVANNTLDVVVATIPALTWNGNVNGNWDIGATANWLNGAAPSIYTETAGSGPFVLFDDTASGTATINLAAAVTPKGITVNSSAKNYTFTGSGSINGNGGWEKDGSSTLTIANTASNAIAGTVTLNAGAISLGNGGASGNLGAAAIVNSSTLIFNRSDNVTFGNAINGAGSLDKEAAGTTTLTGVGNVGGAITVNGGTLALAPAGTITVAGDVTGGGAFGVSGPGAVILTSGTVTYGGGTVISNGTLQFNATFPPAGNIADNGTLALGVGGTLANNISGAGGIFILNGAGVTLGGANAYAGPTTVLGGGSVTATAATYPAASALTLGSQSGNGDIGSANFTAGNPVLGGLNAGGNSQSGDPVSLSAGGQVLTVNGNLKVGNVAPAGAQIYLPFSGSGASVVVNTNGGIVQIGLGAFSSGVNPDSVFVDLSGIDNFVVNLGANTNGINSAFNLGTLDGNPGPPAGATSVNQVNLANLSNSITAGTFTIGAGGRQLTPDLRLGPGTNIFNVATFNVGTGGRDGGQMEFNLGTGGVLIRGVTGGSSRASYNQGVNVVTGTGAPFGTTVDFTGGYADLLFGPMIIGNEPNRAGGWTNVFTFSQGNLDAASLSLAQGCRSGTAGYATVNLNGGTVTLGPVSLTASSGSGTLNINGGAVSVQGVTETGSGNGTLSVSGASLTSVGQIGTAANKINNLSLNNVTLTIGRSAGYGNPTTALVNATNLSISGSCPVTLTGTNYVVGQFPLISYAGSIGGGGFAAIGAFTPPPGVTATLVDDPANQSVDVNITVAPPLGPKASITAVSVAAGVLNLSWQDVGMILQTNAVGLNSPTNWFTVPGSTSVTNLAVTVDSTKTNVFYRLLYP